MVLTDSFFTISDYAKGITAADYERIKPCVETVRSFALTTHQSIYIIDLFKRNFLYVSDNPIILCGQTAETMQKMGYKFFHTHVPEEELPMLKSLNQVAFKVFYNTPAEHRRQCMLSFDFHMRRDDRLILLNQRSTPMALTKDGAIWLTLATVSISSHKEAGHIEFFRFYSREVRVLAGAQMLEQMRDHHTETRGAAGADALGPGLHHERDFRDHAALV